MIAKIFEIILALTGIILIIVVLLQGGKAQGLGGTLTGTSDSNLFQTSKESLTDKKANKLVLSIGIFFVIFSIFIIILSNFGVITI